MPYCYYILVHNKLGSGPLLKIKFSSTQENYFIINTYYCFYTIFGVLLIWKALYQYIRIIHNKSHNVTPVNCWKWVPNPCINIKWRWALVSRPGSFLEAVSLNCSIILPNEMENNKKCLRNINAPPPPPPLQKCGNI